MNYKEVVALRKAFNSVKQRQHLNFTGDLLEMKQVLKRSRELCVGNEELLKKAVDNLRNNGIEVYSL